MAHNRKKKRSIIPSSVAHYSSVEAITKILNGVLESNDGFITLWLSCLADMNDANEGAYILNKYYTSSNFKNELKHKWDNEYYPKNTPFIFSTIKTNNHTRNQGSLPMWKMYGADFKGGLIRFNALKLYKYCVDNDLLFAPCMYKSTQEQAKQIKQLNQKEPDFKELLDVSCLTKQLCWEYEQEWRIVAKRGGEYIKERTTERGNVKYIELKIPLDTIEEICLGPMCDKTATESTLNLLKDQLSHKFDSKVHFNITQSKINIR